MLKIILLKNNWIYKLGAILGTIIGLFILLFSVQFFLDIDYVLHTTNESGIIIINKPVSVVNSLFGKSVFQNDDVLNIKSQSGVKSVGSLRSSAFKVNISEPSLRFYSDIFFESVPSSYLDVDTSQFHWDSGSHDIPIVLAKDYLTLYNFGFSKSQGLPTITPATVGLIHLNINIVSENGTVINYQGKIVGFSKNVNSILVPDNFLEYANKQYANIANTEAPSRLIVKIDGESNKEFTNFLEDKGYEVSNGNVFINKLQRLFQVLVFVILIICGLILLLSGLLFSLNYQLMIQSKVYELNVMKQLGYNDQSLIDIFKSSLMKQILLAGSISFPLFLGVRWIYMSEMKTEGYDIESLPNLFLIASFFLLLFFLFWIVFMKIKDLIFRLK
jgi:hypothetical protein